jgi:hypothetical protein
LATTSTLTAIRERLLRELDLGILIANAKIDSIEADGTGFTAADILRNSRWTANHFSGRGTVINRPTAAAAVDALRYAGALTPSTGKLVHTGLAWADVTKGTENIELWFNEIRPDLEILDAINRALEFVNFSTFDIISHGGDLDYGMTASTDTNWTDVGTPTTSAKSTTARRTPYGLRSYNLVGDAVNEGTQSATLGAVAGRLVSMFAVSSCNSGTARLAAYDVTNSAIFATDPTVTHSEEEPMLMVSRNLTVPDDCTEIAAQLLGTTNPSDIFWNFLATYKHDNLRVNLPSYISDEFKAPSIFQIRGIYSSANNIYDAQGVDFVELNEGHDYRYLSHHPDANPHAIMLMTPHAYEWPLAVQTRRPYSDLGALSAETDTTFCPLHLLMPIVKIRVIEDVLMPRDPTNSVYRAKLVAAQEEWKAVNAVRPIKSVAKKPYFGGVGRGL